ncbi:hypothetical protein MKQ70_11130 [Chitinophaga sedimenti]|uniref:hypothetical protein n=1 Tax=Chitinophaga sedimenti TaxID=2033606 RepID=UPI0020066127|nr:hypothetical protein [Chitinophaga sedimenti]MCK7555530.1 hypothetical protein [Chitinophaga sedimenti]
MSTYSASSFAGEQFAIDITEAGDGPFSAEVENIGIVPSLTVQNKKVVFTTQQMGHTNIHVYAPGRSKATIKVNARMFEGVWRRTPGMSAIPPEVYVESADADFSTSLKAELMTAAPEPVGKVQLIEFSAGMGFFREVHDNLSFRTGRYTYDNLKLTMKYDTDGHEDVFQLERPINDKTGSMAFIQDLTEKYKALHPDKSVTRVLVIKFMRLMTFPG